MGHQELRLVQEQNLDCWLSVSEIFQAWEALDVKCFCFLNVEQKFDTKDCSEWFLASLNLTEQ